MANVPTNLSITQTLELPSFANLTEILKKEPAISQTGSKYAVAIDDTLVYTNSFVTQPAASTAKMILALMIMEKQPFNLGETGENITITQELYDLYAWYISQNGSTVPVQIGETISEYDALTATLLASANNMADTLAVWAFGSLDTYQMYASNRLSEWGFKNTVIGSDASGFSSDTTSTAADLALIGQKLMQNPVLSQIVNQKSYTIPVAGTIENTNQLLGTDGISGIKTGYIGAISGYCLISAYRLGDHIITASVLDTNTRSDSFALTQNLITILQGSLSDTLIASNGTEVGCYDSWWTGKIPIYLNENATILGWQQEEIDPSKTASDHDNSDDLNPEIIAPSAHLNMDGQNGTLSIKSNTATYNFPVTTQQFNSEPDFWQRLSYAISLK